MCQLYKIVFQTDEILIGTIPDFITASRRGSDESVAVPGGLAVVERAGAGWRVRDTLEHDGTKLSQVTGQKLPVAFCTSLYRYPPRPGTVTASSWDLLSLKGSWCAAYRVDLNP